MHSPYSCTTAANSLGCHLRITNGPPIRASLTFTYALKWGRYLLILSKSTRICTRLYTSFDKNFNLVYTCQLGELAMQRGELCRNLQANRCTNASKEKIEADTVWRSY